MTTEQDWLPRGNERDRGDFPKDETHPRGRRARGRPEAAMESNVSTVLRGRHVSWEFTRFLSCSVSENRCCGSAWFLPL